MPENTTTTKGAAAPENTARNLEFVSPSTRIPGEMPDTVEDARRAYNLGCEEREILYSLAHDFSGLEEHFASILIAAGYPVSLAKKYAELAADIGEEEDE
jgi:hypothetical protein